MSISMLPEEQIKAEAAASLLHAYCSAQKPKVCDIPVLSYSDDKLSSKAHLVVYQKNKGYALIKKGKKRPGAFYDTLVGFFTAFFDAVDKYVIRSGARVFQSHSVDFISSHFKFNGLDMEIALPGKKENNFFHSPSIIYRTGNWGMTDLLEELGFRYRFSYYWECAL